MSDPSSQREHRSDGDARRAALLRAATELFAERGYQGASVRAITDRAGANVSAVKYYFEDKAGLYFAALQAAHLRSLEQLPPPNYDELEPEVALRAWLRWGLMTSMSVRLSDQPGPKLLIRTITEASQGQAPISELEQLTNQLSEPIHAQVQSILARLKPNAAPQDRARAAGLIILVATSFAEPNAQLHRANLQPPSNLEELEQLVDALLTFLRAGALALLTPQDAP